MATISDAFARRAREQPGNVAVRGHDGQRTYAELDADSSRLANHLHDVGVRAGHVVGLYSERSTQRVVMLLAILKAGAAYLALDRDLPDGRRDFMLRDAAVTVVLTDHHLPEGLPDACRVVGLDRDRSEASRQPPSPPRVTVSDEQIAYVAYTSGSTGPPKGVCVPHRAVVRLVVDNDFLRFHSGDVVLHFAPVAFDASTFEIWGPLLNGGLLTMPAPGSPSLAELIDFVRRERVTVMWLTAGLFHRAVDVGLGRLLDLRCLISGGDVLSVSHVARVVDALPRVAVLNGYGPTENTTFTCIHTIAGLAGETSVPIGRPVRGTEAYVLDDRLRPVLDGGIGELYAAGLGLAQGYLNSPGLTAGRFVANPFAGGPGARMYRTGDLVRRRPDGAMEFIGRRDNQVKIRGFRVELGEIDAALAELPGVAEAVVVAPRRALGERRLIAYVVGAAGESASAVQIRRLLGRTLPSYAVPALVRVLDALPLTVGGKVDRADLATRDTRDRPDLSVVYRKAESTLERSIVQMWSDHFGVFGIGADDDFFELGGDSLLAATIIEELRTEYGVEASPLEFYLDPTPAGLARVVQKVKGEL